MWGKWFALNNMSLKSTQRQMKLEHRHFQLSSIINGLGMSPFASWPVRDALKSGVLGNPFNRSFETTYAYHLVLQEEEDHCASFARR